MPCARGQDCLAPRCKGHDWRAKSTEPRDYRSFCAEVRTALAGRRWTPALEASIFRAAMKPPCILGAEEPCPNP